MPAPTMRRRTSWIIYLAVVLPLALGGLGRNDVIVMEGIVADGARDMASGGSYVVPRLHGEVYAYKPPLAYWLARASFGVFGAETEWTLRLPFALSGVGLGLVVLLGLGRLIGYGPGLLGGLATVTSALAIQKLRIAEFDILLAAGVGGAIVCASVDLASPAARTHRWLVGYTFLAAGFLAKGLPALMFFIPGLIIAAYATRQTARLLSRAHLAGGMLFVLIVGSWFLSAWMTEGPSAFAQATAEATEKGLGWTGASFLSTLTKPVLALGLFFPWSFAVVGCAWSLSRRARAAYEHIQPIEQALAIAALSFLGGGLLAFMMVPATQSRYLLPIAAPVGMLAAIFLARIERPAWTQASVVLALAISVFHILYEEPRRAASRSLRPIATAFSQFLGPDEVLWSGPVSKHYRHSSLTFYLQRPIRTFRESPPPNGAAVLLFEDEPPGIANAPSELEILTTMERRGMRFALARSPRESTTRSLDDDDAPTGRGWVIAER